MTLEDLIVRIGIEEDNRATEKKTYVWNIKAKANMIEDSISTSKKRTHPNSSKDNGKGNETKQFKGKLL